MKTLIELYRIPRAAEAAGMPLERLKSAIKRGTIETYSLGCGTKLVRLSEVISLRDYQPITIAASIAGATSDGYYTIEEIAKITGFTEDQVRGIIRTPGYREKYDTQHVGATSNKLEYRYREPAHEKPTD